MAKGYFIKKGGYVNALLVYKRSGEPAERVLRGDEAVYKVDNPKDYVFVKVYRNKRVSFVSVNGRIHTDDSWRAALCRLLERPDKAIADVEKLLS